MSIIDTLKSILGLNRDQRGREGSDEPTVRVEHDPDASTESAVKGVEGDDGGDTPASATDDTAAEGVAAETEAAASTGSLLDEGAADDPGRAAEQAEAAGPETRTVEVESTDADSESEDHVDADSESEDHVDADSESEDASEDVRTIKGVGPAYGERLAEVGIETVADLAAADPESLAREADLPESRVEDWVGRAERRK
jgi:predicted flap endonuclease-1-like 5' DNA nuclease